MCRPRNNRSSKDVSKYDFSAFVSSLKKHKDIHDAGGFYYFNTWSISVVNFVMVLIELVPLIFPYYFRRQQMQIYCKIVSNKSNTSFGNTRMEVPLHLSHIATFTIIIIIIIFLLYIFIVVIIIIIIISVTSHALRFCDNVTDFEQITYHFIIVVLFS